MVVVSKARKLMKIVNDIAIHLTDEEVEEIAAVLVKAQDRMVEEFIGKGEVE